MLRFTIRDLLWLMVVVGLALGWWMQAAKYKALERRFDAMIEIVTSDGLITITKTAPGKYHVSTGPVAKELWKNAGSSSPVTDDGSPPAAISRPDP